jgi:hypothetical protein
MSCRWPSPHPNPPCAAAAAASLHTFAAVHGTRENGEPQERAELVHGEAFRVPRAKEAQEERAPLLSNLKRRPAALQFAARRAQVEVAATAAEEPRAGQAAAARTVADPLSAVVRRGTHEEVVGEAPLPSVAARLLLRDEVSEHGQTFLRAKPTGARRVKLAETGLHLSRKKTQRGEQLEAAKKVVFSASVCALRRTMAEKPSEQR